VSRVAVGIEKKGVYFVKEESCDKEVKESHMKRTLPIVRQKP
jgi:hypothetical protein